MCTWCDVHWQAYVKSQEHVPCGKMPDVLQPREAGHMCWVCCGQHLVVLSGNPYDELRRNCLKTVLENILRKTPDESNEQRACPIASDDCSIK